METPIMIYPSSILWRYAVIGWIMFVLGLALGIIISDSRVMNRPVIEHIREVTVIEQQLPTNYFAPTGEWISKGDPVSLTPVKEE
jgi:hypothetical protein